MRSPETFDAFYASGRDRLLHETYALTGDAAAARTAVRDAYTVAWHHWRKVATIDDQEAWLRPVAHGRARRRASARLWHRDKSLDPEVRATLDALARLTGSHRQLLVLVALSPLSLGQVARTVGIARADLEQELERAVEEFCEAREVAPEQVRGLLDDLRAPVADFRWPRAPIVRRAGTARRRAFTTAGSLLAAAAMVASGSLVATGADAEPSHLQAGWTTPRTSSSPATEEAAAGDDMAGEDAGESATDGPAADGPLEEDRLLTDEQVVRYAPALDWTATATADRSASNDTVLPCQREPYAGPATTGALVRTWAGKAEVVEQRRVTRNGRQRTRKVRTHPTRSVATLSVERSADDEAARQAFLTTRGWFASCLDDRTQLVATQQVRRLGDEATQLRLRTWGKQPSDVLVGVARTGLLVVTTVVESRGRPVPDRIGLQALSAAVNRWCGAPGVDTCAGPATGRRVRPVKVGDPSGLLAHVDLPPLAAARGGWGGLEPERLKLNLAATRCDRTSFREKGIRRALTRTFLLPEMPKAQFLGLSQSAAVANDRKRAEAFVDTIRTRVRSCGEANLGTDVTTLASRGGPDQELHAWALVTEVSDSQSFRFLMAVVRDGRTVSQVGFTPDGPTTMARDDFVALAQRALDRLRDLPGSRR